MGTVRQGVLASAVAEGLSIAQAGMLAGYRSPENAVDAYRTIRTKMVEDLAKYGVDTAAIAQKIFAKMNATETKLFSKDGIVTDAVDLEAHGIQLQATELAADLLGLRGNQDKSASIGTINIVWAGPSPNWASDKPVNGNTIMVNGNHNDNKVNDTGQGSTIEGTESGPAPSPQTHCQGSSEGTVSTRVTAAKKKRGPRLPVLGQRNKR